MLDGEKYPYEIIRRASRPSVSFECVDIVRGLSAAQRAVDYYNRHINSEQNEAGVGHYHQRTTKKPWTDEQRRKYTAERASRLVLDAHTK